MSQENDNGQLTLNPYKIWESLYFSTEESLSTLFKKMVETRSFASAIDIILNSYLQFLKIQNEYTAKFIENTPLSSKQDTARVAQLVVALENKFDQLEMDFFNEMAEVKQQTSDLLKQLAEVRELESRGNMEELNSRMSLALDGVQDLSAQVSQLEISLKRLENKIDPSAEPKGEGKTGKRGRRKSSPAEPDTP